MIVPDYSQKYIYWSLSMIIVIYAYSKNFKGLAVEKSIVYGLIIHGIFFGLRNPYGKGIFLGDTYYYTQQYEGIFEATITKDFLFYHLMRISSSYLSVSEFYIVIALIYILVPLYFLRKYLTAQMFIYVGLLWMLSLNFFPYGVNGIRQGIAASFYLSGLMLFLSHRKINYSIVFFSASVLLHGGMALGIIPIILTRFFTLTIRQVLFYWILSVLLIFLFGSTVADLMSSFLDTMKLGDWDERVLAFRNPDEEIISKGGVFRWDFVLYTSIPIIVSSLFLKLRLRSMLLSLYFFTAIQWLVFIRFPYTNRFALATWLLMSLVLAQVLVDVKNSSSFIILRQSVLVLFIFFMFFLV